LITAINNTASLKVKASLTDDGRVQLQATDASTVTVGGLASAAEKAQLGLVDGATTGALNSTRTSLATQFDSIRTQIDQLAGDSGYNGVNLLGGDNLKVVFNEKGTSSQSISGVKFDSAGLGIAASTNKFQTDSDINTAFTNLTAALGSLRSQAAAFGSSLSVVQTRQDFTKAMVNTLQTGSDNLVLADSNQEGANMLALQTRQSLSTTALSLANQASQAVLRLFG
jgi:flagellin-like hook-associated protein FlgL